MRLGSGEPLPTPNAVVVPFAVDLDVGAADADGFRELAVDVEIVVQVEAVVAAFGDDGVAGIKRARRGVESQEVAFYVLLKARHVTPRAVVGATHFKDRLPIPCLDMRRFPRENLGYRRFGYVGERSSRCRFRPERRQRRRRCEATDGAAGDNR